MMTRLNAISIVAPFAVPSTRMLAGAFRLRNSESGFGGRRTPISGELTRPPDRC